MTALARTETTVEQSVEDLLALVNREHALVLQAARGVLTHAIAAGGALLALKERVPYGEWKQWTSENVQFSTSTAYDYMRAAHFAETLTANGIADLDEALMFLRGRRRVTGKPGRLGLPSDLRAEAQRLADIGMARAHICDQLGVSKSTLYKWLHPEANGRYKRALREQSRDARMYREQQREDALRRTVKKQGGAMAELYAMAERMQDVVARAHDEATDKDARRELALAGQNYRVMRDHIVRALGAYS